MDTELIMIFVIRVLYHVCGHIYKDISFPCAALMNKRLNLFNLLFNLFSQVNVYRYCLAIQHS